MGQSLIYIHGRTQEADTDCSLDYALFHEMLYVCLRLFLPSPLCLFPITNLCLVLLHPAVSTP